jgi:hypothetical protein
MPPRLRSDVQISALRRSLEAEGLFVSVVYRGHEEGGMIFLIWIHRGEAMVFSETVEGEERRWRRTTEAPVPETEAEAMLRGERNFDPDLWVLEVSGPMDAADRVLRPLPPY